MPTLQLSAPVRQNFLAKRLGHVSRILPGVWTILEQDFATHPPTYIVDVQPDPKSAQYPLKNFPILAKLLAERYQPVAHTAEGVIYRMR
jgi:hypothetical protein